MGGYMRLRNKKTGEIFDALVREKSDDGEKYSIIVCDIKAYNQSKSTLDATHSILGEYDSLAELNEEWEDYDPVEPEIADETARETIRKWYNKNRIVGKLCRYGGESWLGLRGDDKSGYSWKIELHVDYFSKLINDKLYSLTELCGEEENDN